MKIDYENKNGFGIISFKQLVINIIESRYKILILALCVAAVLCSYTIVEIEVFDEKVGSAYNEKLVEQNELKNDIERLEREKNLLESLENDILFDLKQFEDKGDDLKESYIISELKYKAVEISSELKTKETEIVALRERLDVIDEEVTINNETINEKNFNAKLAIELIKKALFGVIFSIILYLGFLVIRMIFDGKMHCRQDFERELNLKILGWKPKWREYTEKTVASKIINRIENMVYEVDSYEMLCSKISVASNRHNGENIVIIGTVSDICTREFTKKIIDSKCTVNLKVIDSVLETPYVINELKNCGVVILEKNNVTRRKRIIKLLELLNLADVDVLGCIII